MLISTTYSPSPLFYSVFYFKERLKKTYKTLSCFSNSLDNFPWKSAQWVKVTYIKYIALFMLGRKILNDQESHVKILFSWMDYSAYEAEFGLWFTKAESQVVIIDTQLSTYSSFISDTIHKMKGRNPVGKTSRIQTSQIAINSSNIAGKLYYIRDLF